MAGTRTLAIVLAVGLIAGACSGPAAESSGITPTIPSPVATAASESLAPTPSASLPRETAMPFTLTSAAFSNGGAIPRKFTCDGANVSPALSWTGAPAAAVSLALIVDDPDAHGFVHWVVFDMPASPSGGLAEGISASPDAPPQGRNDFGKVGWGGPCPPSGTHHYRFTMMALDSKLALTGAPKAGQVRQAAEGHVLGQVVLTATYRRG